MSDHHIEHEDEFLKQVEKAARKGAASGSRRISIVSSLLTVLLFVGGVFAINHFWNPSDQLKREAPVEGHDLTLENDGFFGYTAADFAQAVLGDSSHLKKLEVYSREVSDVATITDTGLGRLKVFTKTQMLTYHGTVTYTVDLSDLAEKDLSVDEDSHTVTLRIPHSQMGEINIPSDRIEFGEVDKGMLAFGKIKLTAEETASVQSEAKAKMEEKLKEENVGKEADRFAVMSVWEIYHPLIASVSPAYDLKVDFK